MLYYITLLLHVPEAQSFLVMLVAIGVALCMFPMIVKLSCIYNKKIMLVAATIVFTIVFAFIYVADSIANLVPGHELALGLAMGVVVAFPFAAINILPQSVISDIIQLDSLESGVNREGIFSAVRTFLEKIANSIALMIVSSVLTIGAAAGESVGLEGVRQTGIYAGGFTLFSLFFFLKYNDKKVMDAIDTHQKERG
jgi:Na+/melibiose symporter-like transporter